MQNFETIMLNFLYEVAEGNAFEPMKFDFNVPHYIKNYIDDNLEKFKNESSFLKTYNIIKLIICTIPFTLLMILEAIIHNTLTFIDNFIFLSRFNCPIYKWFRWILIGVYYLFSFITILPWAFFLYIDICFTSLLILGALILISKL